MRLLRTASLALILSTAGCPEGRDATRGAADFTVKPPDLGLVELCPPKRPPPGSLSPAGTARRDKERMEQRVKSYQEQLAAYQAQKEQAQKVGAQSCDPL